MSESSRKGFFHQSDARLVPSDEALELQRVVSSVFYGYSPERLAEWCCVSVETAKRWKSGQSSPPPPALRLFQLHRDYKILTEPAWAGWLAKGDVLVDPENNETTQGQLRAYYFVYQLVCEVTRDTPEARERLEQIKRLAG